MLQAETLLMAMNFINEDLMPVVSPIWWLIYGKLSVIAQIEMVIPVTLNITDVENEWWKQLLNQI